MAFEALARAIFRQEGSLDAAGNWITSSLGYRLNNPGNLGYAGQPGASPSRLWDPVAKTFVTYAQFAGLDQGVMAAQRQLALDASRGLTLAQRLTSWSTANHDAYIRNVSAWLGVDPGTPLSALENGSPGNFPGVSPRPGPVKPKGNPGRRASAGKARTTGRHPPSR